MKASEDLKWMARFMDEDLKAAKRTVQILKKKTPELILVEAELKTCHALVSGLEQIVKRIKQMENHEERTSK